MYFPFILKQQALQERLQCSCVVMLLLIRRLYVIDNLQKGDIKLIGQENLVVQSIPKPVPAELVPRGY